MQSFDHVGRGDGREGGVLLYPASGALHPCAKSRQKGLYRPSHRVDNHPHFPFQLDDQIRRKNLIC